MTIPSQYARNYVPIKYFLSSYRALSDGRGGVRHLQSMLAQSDFLVSEWKIIWIGTCTTLRSAIDLFRIDARSCISEGIRSEIAAEWRQIKDNADDHPIYWNFLRKERNNILHEYKWSAYEVWLSPDGEVQAPPTILGRLLAPGEVAPKILMRNGEYEGRDSLELLTEAANWVEDRIFASIKRAGFDPDEQRGVYNFQQKPDKALEPIGALGILANDEN